MAENHKLWGGRFEASLEKWVEEFGHYLYQYNRERWLLHLFYEQFQLIF